MSQQLIQNINKTAGWLLLIIIMVNSNSIFSQQLGEHKWKNRVLIIQSIDSATLLNKQLMEFTNIAQELNDRKMIIYHITEDQYRLIDYSSKCEHSEWFDRNEKGKSKIKYTDENFKVTLVGLDGGIKMETTKLFPKEELFELIDSMPMRRAELKRKKN